MRWCGLCPFWLTACVFRARVVGAWGPRGWLLAPLWGESGVRRSSFRGCPSFGEAIWDRCPFAVGAGLRAWRPDTGPLACVLCWASRAAGPAGGCPGGGYLPELRGASGVRRSPSSGCPPLGRVARFRCARPLGVGGVGAGTRHQPRGCRGAFLRLAEGGQGLGALSLPAAHPWARQSEFAAPRCGLGSAVVEARHWSVGVRALLGVARRGVGGRLPRGGGVLLTVARGVWCQALSLSRLLIPGPGIWVPLPVSSWRG